MIASPIRFTVITMLLLTPLAMLSWTSHILSLWKFGLIIVLVALPVWFVLAYFAAFKKAHRSTILLQPVWWGLFIAGHLWVIILSLFPALATGVGVATAVIADGPEVIVWFAMSSLLVYGIAVVLDKRLARDLRPYARLWPVLKGASLIAAGLVSVAWIGVTALPVTTGSFANDVAAQPRYAGSSSLISQITDLLALLSGSSVRAEDWAKQYGLPSGLTAVWQLITTFSYFWGVALFAAAPLLASSEARRVLRPSDSDISAPVGPFRLAVFSAVTALVMLVVMSLLARLEWATTTLVNTQNEVSVMPSVVLVDGLQPAPMVVPQPSRTLLPQLAALLPSTLRGLVEVEAFGDLKCPVGTMERIEQLDRDFSLLLAQQRSDVARVASDGFDSMRSNVPAFMDWYYSLSAEYLRTGNLLVGSGEEYLLDQLSRHLDRGSPFAAVDTALAYLVANPVPNQDFLLMRAQTFQRCVDGLLPSDSATFIVALTADEDLRMPILHLDNNLYNARLSAAGLLGAPAGAVVGVVLVKIGTKLIAGTVFKMAAGALAKIAGSKALTLGGGMLVGAGTGGVGGSVVPGVGTTAGAIAGGILGGIAAMIGVDYGLLKLDEAVSREAFSAEILASIDESEKEFLELVNPPIAP